MIEMSFNNIEKDFSPLVSAVNICPWIGYTYAKGKLILDYDTLTPRDNRGVRMLIGATNCNRLLRISKRKNPLAFWKKQEVHAQIYFKSDEHLEELAQKEVSSLKKITPNEDFWVPKCAKPISILIGGTFYKDL